MTQVMIDTDGGAAGQRTHLRAAPNAVGALTLLLLLAGCASSPPMHYYTLSRVPGTAQPLSVKDGTVPIRLDRVTIPNELDRSQLVRRIDSTQLQIVETARWAAALDETIRRVLSEDLGARLPAGLVANPNEPSVGEKRQSLAVDISEFYGDGACAVTLRAAWTLKFAESGSSHGDEDIKVPGPPGCSDSAGLPAVMSQALGQLSDHIAARIAQSAQ